MDLLKLWHASRQIDICAAENSKSRGWAIRDYSAERADRRLTTTCQASLSATDVEKIVRLRTQQSCEVVEDD